MQLKINDPCLYSEINKITKALTQTLPIGIFSYIRYYPDDTRFCVSNSENFIQHFVKDYDYLKGVPTPSLPGGLNSTIRIGDTNSLLGMANSSFKSLFQNMVEDLERQFSTTPPYSILLSKPDYLEEFSFFPLASHRASYESLSSNYDLLRHFIFYFLDQSSDLLRNAPRFKFISSSKKIFTKDDSLKFCMQTMKTKKYYLNTDTQSYLTKREAHCAYLISKNMRSQDIAKVMKISSRTVEDYIESIKLKSHISHKSKLQDFLCKSGFDRLPEFSS